MSGDLVLSDPVGELSLLSDPRLYMEQTLGRAIMWLTEVEKAEDVVATKALASAYETFIRERELGNDALLAATEIIRRCERRIGQMVRQGQERGEIRKRGEVVTQRNQHMESGVPREAENPRRSPNEFFGNNAELEATYAMTDGVSDDRFEEAVAKAKEEGNLSRANVVRKVKGDTTVFSHLKEKQRIDAIRDLASGNLTGAQIAKALGRSADYIRAEARRLGIDIPADRVMGKTRQIDPNRVVSETVSTLEGVAHSLGLLGDDLTDLDVEQVAYWVASLSDSIRPLNRLIKTLKEINP